MISRSMAKAQKDAEKEGHNSNRKAEHEARKRLEHLDHKERKIENDHLASSEVAINQELEEQWNAYLATEAKAEEDRANNMSENQQSRMAERLTYLNQEISTVIANVMAKKLPNEEMLTREKYIIVRQNIAKGAMANLYKATDPNLRELVVKVTPLKHDSNLKYIKRYEATFGILRYLQGHPHPNVVRIFEVFATPDKAYVFMDIMEKDDLKAKIKTSGPFAEELSYKYAREIGEGLAFLHKIGVAHENLKPDSIVFDQAGNARIAGLGSVVIWFNPDSNEVIKQTGHPKESFHHHLAPEHRKADGFDPARADIWSFGCLLVCMQTKEWPFAEHSKHQKQVQWKMCYKKAGVPLTDTTWQILTKTFQVEPQQRPSIHDLLDMIPEPI